MSYTSAGSQGRRPSFHALLLAKLLVVGIDAFAAVKISLPRVPTKRSNSHAWVGSLLQDETPRPFGPLRLYSLPSAILNSGASPHFPSGFRGAISVRHP